MFDSLSSCVVSVGVFSFTMSNESGETCMVSMNV